MHLRSPFFSLLMIVGTFSAAHAMTEAEIRAKIEAAGYSQIREMASGKIRTFKAVKDGKERSIIVDSSGHVKELP